MNAMLKISASGAVVPPALLAAARALPILSHEEEMALARRWLDNRDQAAADKLVQTHLRLVIKMAAKFLGYGIPIQELIAEGNVGLVKSLDGFKPELGFRFSTYAQWWIRAALTDCVMRDSSLVKMGTTADQKKLFFRLRRAKAELGFYDDGDLPDEIVKTIASNLEVDPKSVVQMNRRLSGDASLNAPSAETGMEMIDALADADAGPDVILERKDAKVRHSALVEYGLEALNERERDIFVRRNLIDDKLTLEELGAVYGVTRERIRQIEQKALKKFGDRVKRRQRHYAD